MRVMTSGDYDPYPGYEYWNNACYNGYVYIYPTFTELENFGEVEDYVLNFTSNITASFPNDKPDDKSILYVNEVYDGSQRMKNGTLTNFNKPQVTFSSPQPKGTFLNYQIIGPLPSTQVVYEALDSITGSPDIQIGGTREALHTLYRKPEAYIHIPPEIATARSFHPMVESTASR